MKRMIQAAMAMLVLAGCTTESVGVYDRTTHLWTGDFGTFAKDPVSGDLVNVNDAVKRSYLGDTYYFQNDGHAVEFAADPSPYLYDKNPPERPGEPDLPGVR